MAEQEEKQNCIERSFLFFDAVIFFYELHKGNDLENQNVEVGDRWDQYEHRGSYHGP